MACMRRSLAHTIGQSYPLSPQKSIQLSEKVYHAPFRWGIVCADGAEATI